MTVGVYWARVFRGPSRGLCIGIIYTHRSRVGGIQAIISSNILNQSLSIMIRPYANWLTQWWSYNCRIFLLHLLGIIFLSDKVFNCYIRLLTSYAVLMPLLLEEQNDSMKLRAPKCLKQYKWAAVYMQFGTWTDCWSWSRQVDFAATFETATLFGPATFEAATLFGPFLHCSCNTAAHGAQN